MSKWNTLAEPKVCSTSICLARIMVNRWWHSRATISICGEQEMNSNDPNGASIEVWIIELVWEMSVCFSTTFVWLSIHIVALVSKSSVRYADWVDSKIKHWLTNFQWYWECSSCHASYSWKFGCPIWAFVDLWTSFKIKFFWEEAFFPYPSSISEKKTLRQRLPNRFCPVAV